MFVNTPFPFLVSALIHLSISCPLHAPEASHPSSSIRRYAPAPQIKTAITNVRVFDGTCFTPPRTVIISDGLITQNTENISTTIDASGKFLIPGLIDSHVHISSIEGLENATSYGMTTALNMACYNYTLCNSLKRQPGLVDLLTAGQPAVGPNSTHAKSQHLTANQVVTDASNATDVAHWSARNGSDWYKITLETNGPSHDLTKRLVHAVHGLGQQVMAHASDIKSYMQAIETRIDGIQHTPDDGTLTAAAIQTLKHRKKWQFITPTLTIHAFTLHPPNPLILTFLRGTPSPGNSSWSNVLSNVRAMYAAGIPLLAGTDAVGPIAPNISLPFGDTLHRELQYFVEDVGMSNAEALNAATRVAARFHGLRDRGRIEVGLRADLVLLGRDPLGDIKNTRDVEAVWVGGRRFAGLG